MSDRSSSQETSPERSPWSRPGVVLSGAFLLALVLLGVVVAVIGGSGGGRPANTPTTAARQPALQPRWARAAAPSSRQPDGPGDEPPQAQWVTVGSMQVPQNPTVYGPERSDGPWETCFAHDPSGGLLAAMNLWAEGTAVPPSELFQRLAVGAPKNLGSNAQLDRPARFSSPATAMTPTRHLMLRWRSSFRVPRGSSWPSSPRWSGATATGSTCSRLTGSRRCRSSPISRAMSSGAASDEKHGPALRAVCAAPRCGSVAHHGCSCRCAVRVRIDPLCIIGKGVGGAVSSVAGDAITALAKAVLGALGRRSSGRRRCGSGSGRPRSPTARAADGNGRVPAAEPAGVHDASGGAVHAARRRADRLSRAQGDATARARPLLVTYVLVSGAAAAAASVLIGGSDQMASWFISRRARTASSRIISRTCSGSRPGNESRGRRSGRGSRSGLRARSRRRLSRSCWGSSRSSRRSSRSC